MVRLLSLQCLNNIKGSQEEEKACKMVEGLAKMWKRYVN